MRASLCTAGCRTSRETSISWCSRVNFGYLRIWRQPTLIVGSIFWGVFPKNQLWRPSSPQTHSLCCWCAENSIKHSGLFKVLTWQFDDEGEVNGTHEIDVFGICTGIMADSPMRNKVFKNVQWTGLRACDFCTLVGEKGNSNSTKFAAYGPPPFMTMYMCID